MLQDVGDDIFILLLGHHFVFDENIRYAELELITRVVPDSITIIR